MTWMHIDGSSGEGGGQIVRSSLALSLITGRPVEIANIRAGRRRPGLMRQHRTAVQAATAIGAAEVDGDDVGSTHLRFRPTALAGGDYTFSIGTAGSTILIVQTVILALLRADRPSRVRIEGGTHNPFAPPFDYLDEVYLPLLHRMGAEVSLTLERPGFFPAGGGAVILEVTPCSALTPIELLDRGEPRELEARIWLSGLPLSVAHREAKVLASRCPLERSAIEIRELSEPRGPGNAVHLIARHGDGDGAVTELFTAFGEHGVSSEKVGGLVCDAWQDYVKAGMPVGPHLADQLVLPLALAGGGGFRTSNPTQHTKTHIEVIERFLPVRVRETKNGRHDHTLSIESN